MKFILIALMLPIFSQAASVKNLNSERAPFILPQLEYKTSALAPIIDEKTMTIHHGKHHKGYVDKLNAAISNKSTKLTLLEILQSTKKFPASVRNNAGGHWNHSFFWTVLTPAPDEKVIAPQLKARIDKDFGSLDQFKLQFEKQAQDLFGSGWVWLILKSDGSLQITNTQNQDNPLMDVVSPQGRPILALDVWEHAYYLNYQNVRADYIKAFWSVVNWSQVSGYFLEK
jgi:Fe-Mn family superoxide dismutase